MLTIQARSWLDFAAAYDVYDPQSGEKVGGLKRKGFKSMIRDEWIFMDADDNDIGLIQEDSPGDGAGPPIRAVRRLCPTKYTATLYGQGNGISPPFSTRSSRRSRSISASPGPARSIGGWGWRPASC